MVITNVQKVRVSDPAAFAWAGLRKFQNIDLVAEKLIRLQNVPSKYKNDVRKQAQQIRYCLIQAREYFVAAATVSIATKPNLLYYGAMSLALAEILFKQSGDSSLDKARGEHRHHGLTMSVGGIPKSATLSEAAGLIRASPIETGGSRRGTFELWRRTSREFPLAGDMTSFWTDGGSTTGFENLFGAIDVPYGLLPSEGITLAECLSSIPLMVEHLTPTDLASNFVRGNCLARTWPGDEWRTEFVFVIHPSPLVEKLIEGIRVDPKTVDRIEVREIATGLHIVLKNDWINGPTGMPVPPAATIKTDEWRMWTNSPTLNEFGYLYVALFLAGNYARYYPDKWLADVESSSAISLAIEELCSMAEWRVPWLSLCELDLKMYVNEA